MRPKQRLCTDQARLHHMFQKIRSPLTTRHRTNPQSLKGRRSSRKCTLEFSTTRVSKTLMILTKHSLKTARKETTKSSRKIKERVNRTIQARKTKERTKNPHSMILLQKMKERGKPNRRKLRSEFPGTALEKTEQE